MKKFIWQPFVRPAMLLGLVLWACALPAQARQDCDNKEAYAWAKKGYAAFQQGLYDHAYYNYQKSIALACTDYQSAFLEGYNTLALCHFKANDYSTAFKLYLEAGNYAQGKAKSTNYLDLAYTATFFDLPLAKQYFDSVQVKTPRYFSMYTVYLEQVQNYSTMAQLLAVAADTTRGYDGLLLRQNRAKAWLKTGKEAAAIQEWATLWNHSLADNSLKAFASLALGRAYEAQQDTARAMAWYQKTLALEIDPSLGQRKAAALLQLATLTASPETRAFYLDWRSTLVPRQTLQEQLLATQRLNMIQAAQNRLDTEYLQAQETRVRRIQQNIIILLVVLAGVMGLMVLRHRQRMGRAVKVLMRHSK